MLRFRIVKYNTYICTMRKDKKNKKELRPPQRVTILSIKGELYAFGCLTKLLEHFPLIAPFRSKIERHFAKTKEASYKEAFFELVEKNIYKEVSFLITRKILIK